MARAGPGVRTNQHQRVVVPSQGKARQRRQADPAELQLRVDGTEKVPRKIFTAACEVTEIKKRSRNHKVYSGVHTNTPACDGKAAPRATAAGGERVSGNATKTTRGVQRRTHALSRAGRVPSATAYTKDTDHCV